MTMNSFLRGAAAGMVAGAAVAMIAMPKKNKSPMRSGTGRAIKMLGEIVENITDMVKD